MIFIVLKVFLYHSVDKIVQEENKVSNFSAEQDFTWKRNVN